MSHHCCGIHAETSFQSHPGTEEGSKREDIHDKIKAKATAVMAKVTELRHKLHQHPELANREFETNKLIKAHLHGVEGVEILNDDIAYTGIIAVLKGGKPGPNVSLRADIDALPMPEHWTEAEVPFRSKVENVMHACGHDVHTAMLCGTASVLSELRAELPGSVVFYFQPAEEGPDPKEGGGAALMLEQGALDVVSPRPEFCFGFHTGPLPAGTIAFARGDFMAASCFFEIDCKGRGVHGSTPWMGKDPMPAAGTIAASLGQLYRTLPAERMITVSVGRIGDSGGRWNIISDKVTLYGTIRTVKQSDMVIVQKKLKTLAEGICQAHELECEVRYFQDVPALANSNEWVDRLLPSCERVLGKDNIKTLPPTLGYDDVSCFTNTLGGCYFIIGGQDVKFSVAGGGLDTLRPIEGGMGLGFNHNSKFYFRDDAMIHGIECEATVVVDYLLKKASK